MNSKRSICVLLTILAACSSAAPGKSQKRWINVVDSSAYYEHDLYECGKIAQAQPVNPTNGYGNPIVEVAGALARNIAERNQCMAARGWKLVSGVPITVATTPAEAEIWADGHFVGASPNSGLITPGPHKIEVRKRGFISDYQRIIATEGQPVSLSFELKSGTGLLCSDGTVSPTCTDCDSKKGCCSGHGGVMDCPSGRE
jgi:hypothetical protein